MESGHCAGYSRCSMGWEHCAGYRGCTEVGKSSAEYDTRLALGLFTAYNIHASFTAYSIHASFPALQQVCILYTCVAGSLFPALQQVCILHTCVGLKFTYCFKVFMQIIYCCC